MTADGIRHDAAFGALFVSDSEVTANGNYGLVAIGETTVDVEQSSIESNADGGLYIEDASDVSIARSSLRYNDGIAIDILYNAGTQRALSVADSVVLKNAGDGIAVRNQLAGNVRVALDRSTIVRNGEAGIRVVTTDAAGRTDVVLSAVGALANRQGISLSGGGLTFVHARHSDLSGNRFEGVSASATPPGFATLIASGSQINGNGNCGIALSGPNSSAVVSGSTVSHNPDGVCGTGILRTAGDNTLRFNTTNDVAAGVIVAPFTTN